MRLTLRSSIVIVVDDDEFADAEPDKLFDHGAAGARRADNGDRQPSQALDRAFIKSLRMGGDKTWKLHTGRHPRTRSEDRHPRR